jgi:cytoskeletal protein CcmA (bactofilin family)
VENEKRGDLIVNGSGSSAGGRFHNVKLNGHGKVSGDVDCTRFECNGNGTVYGNVKAKTVEINGSTDIKGSLQAESILIKGGSRIHGDVRFQKLKIEGYFSSDGGLKGEQVKLNGKMWTNGDCEAESFEADGQFKISGLLNADSIDIKLYGESKAKEIGGETVKVKQKIFGIHKVLKNVFPVKLVVDTIEGDDIDLESTKAKIVRGNNVRIDSGCDIDLVEYTNDLQQDKKAKVNDSKRI